MSDRVLIVMPHPDDETFSAGGTLALYAKAGRQVTYACATKGELGRNMGKPFFANRETLPALREVELRKACDVLGIEPPRFMGLRDKTLEFIDPAVLAGMVRDLIDELRPSLVITHYPGYGIHPDHDALARATIEAVAAMSADQRPVVHCRALGENVRSVLGEPDYVVNISSVLEIKTAAIRAHRSQSEAMMARRAARMAEDRAFRERVEEEGKRETFWTYHFPA